MYGIKISHLMCLQLFRGFVPVYICSHERVLTEQSIYRILKELTGNYRSTGDILFSQYLLISLYQFLSRFGSRNCARRI